MRVVLDTNVLFAAFVAQGVCASMYEECLLQADIIVSGHILEELARQLVNKGKFSETDARAVVRAVRNSAELVSPKPLGTRASRDPDDDWILATALTAHAVVIVTGDKDLLVLKSFQGIPIVTPRAFLELLQKK